MTGQELFANLAQADELAALRVERDALRARVVELEADPLILAQESRIAELEAERDQLSARVAELEAPPVVPEGWHVARGLYTWAAIPEILSGWWGDRARVVAAYRALAWAIEHDQRPPHAGDKP